MAKIDWNEKIFKILVQSMTPAGIELLKEIVAELPEVWNMKVSSSGKYHRKRKDGTVPTIAEHVYEMLFAAFDNQISSPLIDMWRYSLNTLQADMIAFAIVPHDSFKYGPRSVDQLPGIRGDGIFVALKHTITQHDKLIADYFQLKKFEVLRNHFGANEVGELMVKMIIQALRFHSGRWSTDAPAAFAFGAFYPLTQFVHMLDMLSTRNLINVEDVGK